VSIPLNSEQSVFALPAGYCSRWIVWRELISYRSVELDRHMPIGGCYNVCPIAQTPRLSMPDVRRTQQPVGLNMIYCGKPEFGQISRSFSLNCGAIRLKRSKNLTQTDVFSRRLVKSDRLPTIAVTAVVQVGSDHPENSIVWRSSPCRPL